MIHVEGYCTVILSHARMVLSVVIGTVSRVTCLLMFVIDGEIIGVGVRFECTVKIMVNVSATIFPSMQACLRSLDIGYLIMRHPMARTSGSGRDLLLVAVAVSSIGVTTARMIGPATGAGPVKTMVRNCMPAGRIMVGRAEGSEAATGGRNSGDLKYIELLSGWMEGAIVGSGGRRELRGPNSLAEQ